MNEKSVDVLFVHIVYIKEICAWTQEKEMNKAKH